MAAHSQSITKEIEKEIIRLVLGDSPASIKLFDIYTYSYEKDPEQDRRTFDKRDNFIVESISARKDSLIKEIAKKYSKTKHEVKKILTTLSNPEKIFYLFELTTEIRLEKIIKQENILKLEQVQLFSSFLQDFILSCPYPSYYALGGKLANVPVVDLTKRRGTSSRKILSEFVDIYYKLATVKQDIDSSLSELEQQIEVMMLKHEEARNHLGKEEKGFEILLKEQGNEIEERKTFHKLKWDPSNITIEPFENFIKATLFPISTDKPTPRDKDEMIFFFKILEKIKESLDKTRKNLNETGVTSVQASQQSDVSLVFSDKKEKEEDRNSPTGKKKGVPSPSTLSFYSSAAPTVPPAEERKEKYSPR